MLFDQKGNRKYLTSTERKAFIEAAKQAKPEVETFCLTLAYTGARISEVLALTPARIDFVAEAIIIECLKKRKRGVYRAIPVPQLLLARLEAVQAVPTRQNNSEQRHKRLWTWGRTTAWERVKDVMQAADIQASWAMPKALRHAFGVTGIADAGVPLNMMKKWLGHARIETTAIYANAVGAEERVLAARMWNQG